MDSNIVNFYAYNITSWSRSRIKRWKTINIYTLIDGKPLNCPNSIDAVGGRECLMIKEITFCDV